MSVNNEHDFPWLVAEKRFIRQCVEAGKPIIGICLGAQLIASSMGSAVHPHHLKEIGWFPIRSLTSKSENTFVFPEMIIVFHWHGETFDLPVGAVLLAQSDACEHQAFQLGNNVIGLQFHLETTPQSAQALCEHCRDELVVDTYVQSEEKILAANGENYRNINSLMVQILDYVTTPAR